MNLRIDLGVLWSYDLETREITELMKFERHVQDFDWIDKTRIASILTENDSRVLLVDLDHGE